LNYHEFLQLCQQKSVPEGLSPILRALWLDYRGNWDAAHRIVQDIESVTASSVHAYLHRKEGDLSNAAYWYSRAGKAMPDRELEQEWEALARSMLASPPEV